ncbi:MAG: polysaccharide deacetylase [Burkholderiaceae bacterium]
MDPAPRVTCCIGFDFDAMSSWIGSFGSNNPSAISRGEFGAVAVPRLLDLLASREIRASFAVPGHTALAYPSLVARIRDAGHELVHHGWVHENPARCDEPTERRILEKGLAALERVAGVRPSGYRSPAWALSVRTVELLIEYGFEYDSSCMGHDCRPYYLRSQDQWSVDGAYRFGTPSTLVEMPVSWSLDDFPASEFVPGRVSGLQAASALEENWRGDFDYFYRDQPGSVLVLTLHPQTIGRGNRLLMLERLLDHFASHDGVGFLPMGEFARAWRAANPLDAWCRSNPDACGTGALLDEA